MPTKIVDSYRYLNRASAQTVRGWIKLESPGEIPWTPLRKPLAECTVALVSSGGLALKSDQPFNQDLERDNPWWSDPSYRVIPNTATTQDVSIYHLHVEPNPVTQDLNVLLPLERLAELGVSGEIGRSAPSHYSFMGYTAQPQVLLQESVPAIIHSLQAEGVDVVLLVPA
jgi:D-proline reductase (dithiol) PrdB